MPHFVIVLILYMNLLIKPFFDKKMSIFDEYGAFKYFFFYVSQEHEVGTH